MSTKSTIIFQSTPTPPLHTPNFTEMREKRGILHSSRGDTEAVPSLNMIGYKLFNFFKEALFTMSTFTKDHAEKEPGLVVSPYESAHHLLDLSSVSKPCQLLAMALAVMRELGPDYATTPYIDAFNWPEVMDNLYNLVCQEEFHWSKEEFYIVVFRSQIPLTTNRAHLGKLDEDSHAEATKSGGLLKYWFGAPNKDGRNLATC